MCTQAMRRAKCIIPSLVVVVLVPVLVFTNGIEGSPKDTGLEQDTARSRRGRGTKALGACVGYLGYWYVFGG